MKGKFYGSGYVGKKREKVMRRTHKFYGIREPSRWKTKEL